MTRPLYMAIRKSPIAYYFSIFTLVVVLNSFTRGNWGHEWNWAADTLAFSSVFLIPLIAGASALETSTWSQSRDLLVTSRRPLQWLLTPFLPVLLAAWGAIAVGFAATAITVLITTRGHLPNWQDLTALLPLLAVPLPAVTGGALFGWFFPGRLIAPVVSITSFAIVMFGYISGIFEPLVAVGGATGSLVGLAYSPTRAVLQTFFFVCLAWLALSIAIITLLRTNRRRIATLITATLASLSLACVLVTTQQDRFIVHGEAETCVGTSVRLCAAPGYSSGLREAETAASRYIAALKTITDRTPHWFSQSLADSDAGAVLLSDYALLGDTGDIGWAIASWYIPKGCDITVDRMAGDAYTEFQVWLEWAAFGEDSLIDVEDLLPKTEEERDRWGASALASLESCGT